jgi:hypothetical protein
MTWDSVPSSAEYHVYMGSLANLDYTGFGSCRDDLDADRTDTQLADAESLAPGTGRFYLITAESSSHGEGSLGSATCVERSNFNACP